MEGVSSVNKGENYIELPPGFRFHPTDEEIITHYLSPKVLNHGFSSPAIGEVDLNKCEPWDLPSKAKMGEKEWYFFCQRDRKYPTGMRTNRATESGYWKSTGKDKEIFRGVGVLIGMKKTLVFYKGRAPKGEKTNWVMHEFRIEGKYLYSNPHKDEWVVCRVLHKNMGVKKTVGFARMNSFFGEHPLDSPILPSVMDSHYLNSLVTLESLYIKGDEDFDFATPSYFPTMVDLCSNINYQANSFNQSSDFYPQIPPLNPYFSFPGTEMLRTSAIIGSHCKAQHSVTIASQDTGLSNDRNIEISSAMLLTQEMGGGYDDLDYPSSSAEPVMNLENMWGC